MLNNNTFFNESDRKKYSLYIFNQLSSFNLPDSYISENLHIVKEWKRFLDKLKKCNTHHSFLENQQKTLQVVMCNQYTVCPICASVKRYSILKSIIPYYKQILNLKQMGKLFIYEATATIAGSKDLSSDFEKLRESWKIFFDKGKKNQDKRRLGESSKIIGYIMSIEVTKNNETKKWHVHGHAILITEKKIDFTIYNQEKIKELYKKYGFSIPKEKLDEIINEKIDGVPVSKLTREWFEATKGSGVNFFIKLLKPGLNFSGKYVSEYQKIFETIKYVTKISELSPMDVFTVWDILQNKKRITKGGIFSLPGRKKFVELLSENNLLDDFLADISKPKIDTIYEPITERRFDFNSNSFDEEMYNGIYDYHWYHSQEYKEMLSNRNYIIQNKKNNIKELNNMLCNKEIFPHEYIESKENIIENSLKNFSDNIKIKKSDFLFSKVNKN